MKNATPDQESSALTSKEASAHTDRIKIIALLKEHQSVSTPEFRQFGIMSPAPRILELRAQGHRIEKILESYMDDTGKVHRRVARYYFANNPPAFLFEQPNKENGEKAA